MKMVNGHYQITLIWTSDTPHLPNNKSLAEKRLQLLKKKWSKRDPKLLERYKETMGDYLAKGHAMRITVEGPPSCDDDAPIWYLPHPVIHPQKPEKVRIVFDCAEGFRIYH